MVVWLDHEDLGWLTDDYTPFKNSDSSHLSQARDTHYSYDASVCGNGDLADPAQLTQPPRQTTASIAGTTTGIGFSRYIVDVYSGPMIETRRGASAAATWASGVLDTSTTLTGYDSYTQNGPLGSIQQTADSSHATTTVKSLAFATLSTAKQYFNPFGGLSNPTTAGTDQSTAIGEEPQTTTASAGGDQFGFDASVTENGLKTSYSNYNWFGAQTVTAADGQVTRYTYTDDGRIRSVSDADGVTTTYSYDAAGNITHTHVSGGLLATDTFATYDAQGRITSSTDELGNVTQYDYSSDATGTIETIGFQPPGGSNSTIETIDTDLDGTQTSDSGSSVQTPSTADEGVTTSSFTSDGVTVPVGSTWTLSASNSGSDTIKTYSNLLGQQILSVATGPSGSTEYSKTLYDGDGRPAEEVVFDGTDTHTDYNPSTGQVMDQWIDVNGDGSFTPGADSKQENRPTAATSFDGVYSGGTTVADSTSGVQQDFYGTRNAGLDSESIVDGAATTTHTATGSSGNDTVYTENPDGTQNVDSYVNGLLSEADTYDTAAQVTLLAKTTFGYDTLARNTSVTQYQKGSGGLLSVPLTTTYTLRLDGSISQTQTPDGAIAVNSFDPLTGTPKSITTPNGTIAQGVNNKGQVTSQSGGGVIPSTFDYNSTTGQISDLHLFPSGSTSSATGEQTTHYSYDPNSGDMTSIAYGYNASTGSSLYSQGYSYNANGLVNGISRPGSTLSNFVYNSSGNLLSSRTTDASGTASNGTTFDTGTKLDDLGRLMSVSETATGPSNNVSTAVNGFTYDPIFGQLATESQVAGVTTQYDYYGPNDNAAGQEPGAVKDMLLVQNGVVINSDAYTYDDSGRLYTNTVNGKTTFTYTYVNGTSLVANVAVSVTGTAGNTLSTNYNYYSTDMLSGITTSAGSTTLYTAGYTYQSNNQRQTESVTQLKSDNSTTDTHAWTFGYDGQQQLTSVTNTSDSSTVNSYNDYNAVGARTDLGTINALNQYSTFSYNPNGDITDDGTDTYTWDAKDRLTSITPDSPTNGAEKDTFSYDGQDRRIGKTIYTWNSTSGAWVLSKSLNFIYDNRQIVAEVDAATNDVLQTYAWSATGTLQSITDYTTTTPKIYAAITEPNGSIQQLVDMTNGQIVASWRYDAWGNVISSTGSTSLSPFGWQGLMSDSGSNYLDASREMNSRDRLFQSLDKAGQLADGEMYRAISNDPVNKVDPTGMAAEGSSAPLSQSYSDVLAMGRTFGINTLGLYDRATQVKLLLLAQAQAENTSDAVFGGGRSASALPSAAQLQLDYLSQNPSALTSAANAGAANQYLSGQSATALPGAWNVFRWQSGLAQQSNIDIAQSMEGWHEDVKGGQRFIPVWGSAKQSVYDFNRGDYLLSGARIVNAFSELVGVRALATGGARIVASAFTREGAQVAVDEAAAFAPRFTLGFRSGMVINPFARSAGFASQLEEGLASGMLREVTPREMGIVAPPDHHLFPQEFREWFAARGIDVDHYTITLDKATHDALHAGGGLGKGGGWWNDVLMQSLFEREINLGRKLTPDEIIQQGQIVLKRAGIDDLPVHPWNSTK